MVLYNYEYSVQLYLYMFQMLLILVYNLECMKKVFNSLTTETNKDTGEVTEIEKSVTVTTGGGDKFFMTFLENMSSFYNISCVTDVKVLAKMCSMAEYNTYQMFMPKARRKEIMDEIGINTQTMSNALSRLRGIGMISGSDGMYEINPVVFWKGSTKERERLLKTKGIEIKIKFKIEDEVSALQPSKQF